MRPTLSGEAAGHSGSLHIPNFHQSNQWGEVFQLPVTEPLPAGRYRVRAEVRGFVYPPLEYCRGFQVNDGRPINPGGSLTHVGFVPEGHRAHQVGMVANTISDAYRTWVLLNLSPVNDDSSTFAAETVVSYREPWALYVYRHYAVRNGCAQALSRSDQVVTYMITPEPLAPPQQPKLVLTCSGDLGENRVTRGKEIACTASKDPASGAGELKITGWSFEGRARTDGDVTSTRWSGIAVEGGTVSVTGTINGQTASPASASITVVDRNWGDVLRDARIAHEVCAKRTNTCLQTPPRQYQDLGKTHLPESEYTLPVKHVAEGPNSGWWFIAGERGPVILPQPTTYLHPELLDPGSGFYRSRICISSQVLDWITNHERTHVEIGRMQLLQRPINPWLEKRRVFSPTSLPDRWYNEATRRVRRIVGDLMDPEHKAESRYQDAPCDLRLSQNTSTGS